MDTATARDVSLKITTRFRHRHREQNVETCDQRRGGVRVPVATPSASDVLLVTIIAYTLVFI